MSYEWELERGVHPEAVGSVFGRSGFVVLRRVLDHQAVRDLAAEVTAEFARVDAMAETLTEDLRRSVLRGELPAHPAHAPFRLNPKNYYPLVSSGELARSLYALLSDDYVWHYPPMFRRIAAVSPDGTLPYHQDCVYNARYKKLMTCFVPLGDCGAEAPGIELVEGNISRRFEHVPRGPWEFAIASRDVAKLLATAAIHRPELGPGDVVVFNEHTVHATYYREDMRTARLSMDARAVPVASISRDVFRGRRFISARRADFERVSDE